MMGTEIFKIDALWAEILTKTRVSFLMNPSVAVVDVVAGAVVDWTSPLRRPLAGTLATLDTAGHTFYGEGLQATSRAIIGTIQTVQMCF